MRPLVMVSLLWMMSAGRAHATCISEPVVRVVDAQCQTVPPPHPATGLRVAMGTIETCSAGPESTHTQVRQLDSRKVTVQFSDGALPASPVTLTLRRSRQSCESLRVWQLGPLAPGRYSGRLTEAEDGHVRLVPAEVLDEESGVLLLKIARTP